MAGLECSCAYSIAWDGAICQTSVGRAAVRSSAPGITPTLREVLAPAVHAL